MKTQQEILARQEQFLNRYNPMHTEERALQSGINAAVKIQHPVYDPNITYQQKSQIKDVWRELLKCVGKKYEQERTEEDFVNDIVSLQKTLDKKFPGFFFPGINPQNFRIAQAQKSLSVYLKHMWCMGMVKMPPVCPIDRQILGDTWIYDDMEMYKRHLDSVKGKNNTDDPLAVWELFAFYR